MEAAAGTTRTWVAVRLARWFALDWAIVVAIFVIPVLNGGITWRGWLRTIPAAVVSPFVAIPLLFACLSICRPAERFWLRLAQVVFVLWWLGVALVMGLGV